jgi:hypothetical protein
MSGAADVTPDAVAAAIAPHTPPSHLRVTQWNVLRSEWTKFWTLRSTRWALLIAVILGTGLGILGAYFRMNHWAKLDPDERLFFDPAGSALRGVFLAQLAIGVLGVLTMTGEYATGMIRATFGAVPTRLPVLWAKLAVYGVVAYVLMQVAAFAAFFATQPIFHQHNVDTTLGAPHVLRAVLGAAAYLTLIGLMGVSIGSILRSTAGAISALAGLLFVLPVLSNILPQSWQDHFTQYLPTSLGDSLFSVPVHPHKCVVQPKFPLCVQHALGSAHDVSAMNSFWLLVLYTAVITAAAAVLLMRRDV